MNTQRAQAGALFGLDARMAIAVFAIIAVIAGYVAWGRIVTAKDTVLIADIQALDEALAGYQADMGTFYLFTLAKDDPTDTGAEDLEALWDKTKVLTGFQPHWNGPYVHRDSRQHKDFGKFTVFYAQGDRTNICVQDSDCYVWLSLTHVPAKVWERLNLQVDENGGRTRELNGTDITSGRVQAVDLADPRTLIYRSVARPL
ncbi:MAG: hypothetical protein WAZ18_04760 [Alphaproteobacteria bacterium]